MDRSVRLFVILVLFVFFAAAGVAKPVLPTPTPAPAKVSTTPVPLATKRPPATQVPTEAPSATEVPSEVPSETSTPLPDTDTPTATVSPTVAPPTATVSSSPTLLPPSTQTRTATPPGGIVPFRGAPLCAVHDNEEFHTLWNPAGCHYDHEHGTDPFTPAVAAAFPGLDLRELLGDVEIGHTNLSGPMENTMKHGGFKWDVELSIPCPDPSFPGGFEGAQNCVASVVIQYHNFGRYELEMETRIHTTAALVKACRDGDCGYLYAPQFQEYGQRVTPYQGSILDYPDNFLPLYPSPRGPYFTTDCFGTGPGCRESLEFIRSRGANTNSIWTSKPTGSGPRPQTSSLFRLLFRVRDTYQVLDSSDQTHPFTWPFVCGGEFFSPSGCRYNNSTSKVHEVAGNIPVSWDSLDGVVDGRVTYEGFTTRFGALAPACTEAGFDCHPVKLVNFPVGSYGGALPGQKISNPSPTSNPERDIYFCGSVQCIETAFGAVPSGWIGSEN